ncbi:signal transduction histidine kinase [Algoriphagus ratkowskyi]|uniref:histidine kinase n=1 Tax=Algoriphagus ratkowskyi TaxID=57028 RepID=A0A2W7QV59_9BACT|nr:ATP-binding protein [Algoriphagus ratkowskyi]PZX51086.1 signal transduction histidine kinase [Algoriphagus ratkowskyi]TXD75874.1 response regulator [Algoriphagus ratkowskyi]
MKRNSPSSNTAGKVVTGFFLAAIFLIGMAGLTYYIQNRLLETMKELAEPSQKLTLLNKVQSDIIQITQMDQSGVDSDFRIQDSSAISLKEKLQELASLAEDSLEISYIHSVQTNLDTLIVGYVNLYEVKTNLANRNFTQEALNRVELGIRRRAASLEQKPIEKVNPKDQLFNDLQKEITSRQEAKVGQTIVTKDYDKSIAYLRDLQKQNLRVTNLPEGQTLDSVLHNIKGVIDRVNREESNQRQKLAKMEADISISQSKIINTIQSLVSTLQARALEKSDIQNESAYKLTYDMTYFLILIVVLAVIGAAIMVYSILKEIKVTKKYQENLEVARQKSEQLARSKQEFLANMSHEIRNPLHVIQGYRSVLEKSELDSSQQSHLRMIGFASDTLMEIVDEVLDFSKLEAGKLKLDAHPFDPESLFSSLQNFFELQASEKKVDFEWSLDLPEDSWLIGDQLRLKQILNNLLSNAFKFTSEGSICVVVRWVDGLLTVEIKDTGIGMSQEVLDKVFREFDQADTSISRKYGGTGLGLAIVHRLVSLMNGEILVSSVEHAGTTMLVQLPMVTTASQRVEFNPDQIVSLDLSGLKILLVDDDKVGIRYLETILSYFGASVIAYPGGTIFRDEFVAIDFDLAILDIQMPEFSGFDVVNKLRSMDLYLEMPILAMTANVFVEEREKMIESGFTEIIFKPFQERVLIECLGKFFPNHVVKDIPQNQKMSESDNSLFQLKDLARFCMGDELLLQDIVRELVVETQKDLNRINRARKNDDFDEILEICHQLGSRLGQIKSGAGHTARKLENSLKIGNKNGLGDTLNQLDEEIRILLAALTETMDKTVNADN